MERHSRDMIAGQDIDINADIDEPVEVQSRAVLDDEEPMRTEHVHSDDSLTTSEDDRQSRTASVDHHISQTVPRHEYESRSSSVAAHHTASSTTSGKVEDRDVEKHAPVTLARTTTTESRRAFSTYTTRQKRFIALTASVAGLISPFAGAIYYPAITTISQDLHVSNTQINLTVTTYMIIQGLAPMMIAGFSDDMGRRPAYLVCFVICMAANLGLALQDSYVALLVLRMLQSGGSSGLIALNQAVIADLVTSEERGSYIVYSSLPGVLGPTLSPILGGVLAQYLGWHSVFWCLFITVGSSLCPLLSFCPRRVGKLHRAANGIQINSEKEAMLRANYKFRVPNPLSTLVVLTDFASCLILLGAGLAISCTYTIFTGASVMFRDVYGFDDLHVSLMFLPIGGGAILAAYVTGKLLNFNYRRHARAHNFPLDRTRARDLTAFPLENARLQISIPTLILGSLCTLAYGWVMTYRLSLAGPIILFFLMGFGLTASFSVLNVLMIDIYPGRPATATAAGNLVRCELGAAATAAIGPMMNAIGYGWSYSIIGLLCLAYVPVLGWVSKRGMGWRQEKKRANDEKIRIRAEKKAAEHDS